MLFDVMLDKESLLNLLPEQDLASGNTPLHSAMVNGHSQVAHTLTILLQPNQLNVLLAIRNNRGPTPMDS